MCTRLFSSTAGVCADYENTETKTKKRKHARFLKIPTYLFKELSAAFPDKNHGTLYCHSPCVAVEVLKHLPSHGVVVGVQVDFNHGVNGVLTPVVVLSSFVEVLKSVVGLPCEPERQTHGQVTNPAADCSMHTGQGGSDPVLPEIMPFAVVEPRVKLGPRKMFLRHIKESGNVFQLPGSPQQVNET